MSKDELLLPARSESSCSQLSLSATDSSNISPDTLRLSGETLCDTSSEVSDEGYKSSQGNVSAKTEESTTGLGRENTHISCTEGEGERLRDDSASNSLVF